ncbi:MAG: phosphoribosylformylglycinamidine cyclo-ligase [Planctomycetota bacterium]|nr:phosphoribosylformylglycinamidine cyclo-ligase [Planctomycetota bacterium]
MARSSSSSKPSPAARRTPKSRAGSRAGRGAQQPSHQPSLLDAMQRSVDAIERVEAPAEPAAPGLSYAKAGIELEAKDRFTDSLSSIMRRTFGPRVIDNPGGFAGLFRLDYNQKLFARNYREPVLVACADGVGTKVKLARELGVFDTVGIDLVAMNVNDLIVQGAEPLIFLDYIAVPSIDHQMLQDLVRGIADGCVQAGAALIGGETAHMPDLYAPGDFDLAGFCVGVVELKRAIKPERVRPGDVVLGLASSGIHSNGYTLVRKVVQAAGLDLRRAYSELSPSAGKRAKPGPAPTLGQVLLTPTRIYAGSIVKLLRSYRVKNVVTGMAHITGSGLAENLVRALPGDCDAVIDRASWPVPPVFTFLQKHGQIDSEEMKRVFNLGIGYCVIVKKTFADAVADTLRKSGETVFRIGQIVKGSGKVRD